MTRIAWVAVALLFLAFGPRPVAAHDGDHFGPDG